MSALDTYLPMLQAFVGTFKRFIALPLDDSPLEGNPIAGSVVLIVHGTATQILARVTFMLLYALSSSVASEVIRQDFTHNYGLRMEFDDSQKISADWSATEEVRPDSDNF